VLIAQRPPGKHLAGRWEFPGGKLDAGEDRRAGLARELREELGITLLPPLRPLIRVRHTYDYGEVLIDMWVARQYSGEPRGLEGQALRWCTSDELESVELLSRRCGCRRGYRRLRRETMCSGVPRRRMPPDGCAARGAAAWRMRWRRAMRVRIFWCCGRRFRMRKSGRSASWCPFRCMCRGLGSKRRGSWGRRGWLRSAASYAAMRSAPSSFASARSNVPIGRCPALRAISSTKQSENPSEGVVR